MSEIKTSFEERLQNLYEYRKEIDLKDPEGVTDRVARRSHSDNANYIKELNDEICLLLEQSKQQLRDKLTGVYNKASFEEFFQKEIAEAERHKKPFVLLFLDIDNFKIINDTFGHLVGDKALKIFGNLLTSNFRKEDVISRYGGDEFTVITKEYREKNESIIEGKCLNVEKEFKESLNNIFVGQHDVLDKVGVSIGISKWREGFDMNKMIAEADGDMYDRKNKGKNEQK